MSRNKRTTHVIDSLFLLHILLTAYRVPRSQLLRQLALLHISLTAYRVPRSQLLRQLALLYIPRTAYRVPRSRLLRQLALFYLSITAYRIAGYAEVSSSDRVFCSYSNITVLSYEISIEERFSWSPMIINYTYNLLQSDDIFDTWMDEWQSWIDYNLYVDSYGTTRRSCQPDTTKTTAQLRLLWSLTIHECHVVFFVISCEEIKTSKTTLQRDIGVCLQLNIFQAKVCVRN